MTAQEEQLFLDTLYAKFLMELPLMDVFPRYGEDGRPMFYVGASGHRPQKIGGFEFTFKGQPNPKWDKELVQKIYDKMDELIERAIAKFGETHNLAGISGGALGIDTMWARRWAAKGLPFYLALPCYHQENRWAEIEQARYGRMLVKAAGIKFVHEGEYNRTCMEDRNQWMVNASDAMVFFWDGTRGGTGNCIGYSRKVGKPEVVVNPKEL